MWIEILSLQYLKHPSAVTPLAGVWIEIIRKMHHFLSSHVTPLAGVWIEIDPLVTDTVSSFGHSPCGSVD